LPLALASAVRSSVPRAAADNVLSHRPRPLVELDLPLECYPAIPTRPPRRPGPLMGFGSLQHMRNSRSTHRRPSQPATFRLQGLATLLAACALESRAGFVSHRRRSWDSSLRRFPLPTGVSDLSVKTNLRTVGSAVSPPLARQTGPTSLGFQVHTCRDCLVAARRFRPTATGASLGFCPSRVCWRRPGSRLPRNSSRVLDWTRRSLAGPLRTSECRSTFASRHLIGTGVPTL